MKQFCDLYDSRRLIDELGFDGEFIGYHVIDGHEARVDVGGDRMDDNVVCGAVTPLQALEFLDSNGVHVHIIPYRKNGRVVFTYNIMYDFEVHVDDDSHVAMYERSFTVNCAIHEAVTILVNRKMNGSKNR